MLPKLHENYRRAENLELEILTLAGHLNAANFRFLCLIRELDECQPWSFWGVLSCAHWLNFKCGIGMNAAREKVRVAHALADLSEISATFERGEISYSMVRAMTRVATAENEDYLLMIAQNGSAAQVEKLVRSYRGVQQAQDSARTELRHESRALEYHYDDDGSLVIKVRLEPEQGAVVLKALQAAVDSVQAEMTKETNDKETLGLQDVTAVTSSMLIVDRRAQQRSDALLRMAESYLSKDAAQGVEPSGRYQVMLHVSAETLLGAIGRGEIEEGPFLSTDTLRRLGCDTSVVVLTEDNEGNPLNVGRKTRVIPPALKRALKSRDEGCRFPGCTRRHFVDAHHIEHWANGGETKLSNLVQLCHTHHRMVHEGGVAVSTRRDGDVVFNLANGQVVSSSPPAKSGSTKALLDKLGTTRIEAAIVSTIGTDMTMDFDMAVSALLAQSAAEQIEPAQERSSSLRSRS